MGRAPSGSEPREACSSDLSRHARITKSFCCAFSHALVHVPPPAWAASPPRTATVWAFSHLTALSLGVVSVMQSDGRYEEWLSSMVPCLEQSFADDRLLFVASRSLCAYVKRPFEDTRAGCSGAKNDDAVRQQRPSAAGRPLRNGDARQSLSSDEHLLL